MQQGTPSLYKTHQHVLSMSIVCVNLSTKLFVIPMIPFGRQLLIILYSKRVSVEELLLHCRSFDARVLICRLVHSGEARIAAECSSCKTRAKHRGGETGQGKSTSNPADIERYHQKLDHSPSGNQHVTRPSGVADALRSFKSGCRQS